MALVQFHMADNERKSEDWDHALKVYCGERVDGIPSDVPEDEIIARNLAYETADAMTSTLVPRNPELKVTAKRTTLRAAANAQEGLVREAFRQDNLEGCLRKAVTFAALHEYSIIKTVWKNNKQRASYRAIQAKNIFFDRSAERWDEIRYIGEITVRSLSEIKRRAKRKKGSPSYKKSVVNQLIAGTHVPDWLTLKDDMDEKVRNTLLQSLEERVVVELLVFDPDGGPTKMLHLVPGVEEPLLDISLPYHHMRNPFTLVSLEVPVKGLTGVSPYSLIRALGAHLNQLESLRASTAKASIPVPIVNQAALQNPDAFFEAFRRARDPREMVEIELAQNVPLTDVLMFSQTPGTTIDYPQAIQAVQTRIDTTLGLPSYLRAGNSNADFSAELQLQSSQLANRAGARRKSIHDVITEVGVKTLQLFAEKVDYDDIIYVRASDGDPPQEVTRDMAALNLFAKTAGEAPLEMDYTVRVVDEATENPVVRLQALQPLLPVLIQWAQRGLADEAQVALSVLKWLGLERAIPDEPGAAPIAPGAGMPVPEGLGVSGGQSGMTGTQPPSVTLPPTM
jgi:hypothetical protein